MVGQLVNGQWSIVNALKPLERISFRRVLSPILVSIQPSIPNQRYKVTNANLSATVPAGTIRPRQEPLRALILGPHFQVKQERAAASPGAC